MYSHRASFTEPSREAVHPPPILSSLHPPSLLPAPPAQESVENLTTSQNQFHHSSVNLQLKTARGRVERRKTKTSGRGLGSKNYTSIEVAALLDCVESVLPLGYQEWSIVANRYAAWQAENEMPFRDLQGLKAKFDKLVNTKKPTGSPDCPVPVRRAKKIAKSMQSRCVAASLSVESGSDEDTNGEGESSRKINPCADISYENERKSLSFVRKRVSSRSVGAAGIKARSSNEPLISLNQVFKLWFVLKSILQYRKLMNLSKTFVNCLRT